MRLRLETFDKISILSVSRTVSVFDSSVLAAGVSKLAKSGRRWIFIDLGKAMLDLQASQFLVEYAKQEKPSDVDVHWVGNFSELCVYEELTDALDEIGIKDFKALAEKIEIENRHETLVKLLDARGRLLLEVNERKKTIESVESYYREANRNLRAAQTQLINRFLDPVFAELWSEPLAGEKAIAEFEAVLGKLDPKGPSLEVKEPGVNAKPFDPYLPKNLSELSSQLRSRVKELQKEAKNKILDGKGDRSVSLLLENDTLRERIHEIRDAWIQALECDSRITNQDFESGFQPLLQKIAELEILKANPVKKAS